MINNKLIKLFAQRAFIFFPLTPIKDEEPKKVVVKPLLGEQLKGCQPTAGGAPPSTAVSSTQPQHPKNN